MTSSSFRSTRVGGVYKLLRSQPAGVAGVCAVSAQGFASRDCMKYMKMRVFCVSPSCCPPHSFPHLPSLTPRSISLCDYLSLSHPPINSSLALLLPSLRSSSPLRAVRKAPQSSCVRSAGRDGAAERAETV